MWLSEGPESHISSHSITAPAPDGPPRYALHPDVGLRDERFGALAYHYGNRRLTFLNDPRLVAVVRSLGEYDDVDDALAAADIPDRERAAFRAALSRLADAEVIVARD